MSIHLPISIERIDFPDNYHFRVSEVGISLSRVYSRFTIERFDVYGQWEGVIGPGVVIIESVERTENSDLPYSSQLTKAVHQHEYELETLKYIFMDNVSKETLGFLRNLSTTRSTSCLFISRRLRGNPPKRIHSIITSFWVRG